MKTTMLPKVCLAWLLIGWAAACAPRSEGTLLTVSAQEVAQLPEGCAELLGAADENIAWARAAGRGSDIVIDTPDGACVDDRTSVITILRLDKRFGLADLIARDFQPGDPSPHPEQPGSLAMGEPSPHPERPQAGDSAELSSPRDGDSGGTGDPDPSTLVIVIQIGAPGSGSSGDSTHATPSVPRKP